MPYTAIENLLKQATGLDAALIGSSTVKRAAQARAATCAMDAHAYLELLRTSATELQALIDAVVVPETWFFRDPEAFAEMGRMAHDEWLPVHPQGTLRLLSLPCSTGEEAYSMAMALLDTGFPATRCHVDAFDISTQSLARAERGVYGKNSFRGAELGFRERHFDVAASNHSVRDSVRRQVSFQHGNLFADFLAGAEVYDVIFCRNLLIYFDEATQTRAIEVLRRLLTPEGVLFVGPAEAGLLLSHDFRSAKVPLAFAFRKALAVPCAAAPTSAQPIQRQMTRPTVPVSLAVPRKLRANPAERPSAEPAILREPVSVGENLQAASGLADQGRLVEAAQSCEEHLRRYGPSVQAFHLMGLIRAAVGNLAEANQYYRKALYLDQNHQETLLHLGLLLTRQGDAAGARVLRNRLRRLDHESVK